MFHDYSFLDCIGLFLPHTNTSGVKVVGRNGKIQISRNNVGFQIVIYRTKPILYIFGWDAMIKYYFYLAAYCPRTQHSFKTFFAGSKGVARTCSQWWINCVKAVEHQMLHFNGESDTVIHQSIKGKGNAYGARKRILTPVFEAITTLVKQPD